MTKEIKVENEFIKLNNGTTIPRLGFGTSHMFDKESLITALKVGYKHIDCAVLYGNQNIVGQGIKEFLESNDDGITRKDLFITSKLYNEDHEPKYVYETTLKSIKDLECEYIDLLLIHWPLSWIKNIPFVRNRKVSILDTWKAMCNCVDKGYVKSVGVSNFDEYQLGELLTVIKENNLNILPVVNQIEIHPHFINKNVVNYCFKNNITPVAWGPINNGKSLNDDIFLNNIVKSSNYKFRNVYDLSLQWNMARNVVVIPSSNNPKHIQYNYDSLTHLISNGFKTDLIGCININSNRYNKRRFPDMIGVWPKTAKYYQILCGYIIELICLIIFGILYLIRIKIDLCHIRSIYIECKGNKSKIIKELFINKRLLP